MTIVHNSQKTQWSVLLLQCLYTANDKYPAAIHTSNRVYTTSTQHTQLLYFYQLYQLGTGARAYKAFSSPSHVILHIISYIVLCSYYLFTSTQKNRQAPTIRAQFTKKILKTTKFRRFKTSLCNHHSPKPGHITASPIYNFVTMHNVCICYDCTT